MLKRIEEGSYVVKIAGLYQHTQTGYGIKIRTNRMIQRHGEKIWRRVYAGCYSNVASFYVIVKGERFYLGW